MTKKVNGNQAGQESRRRILQEAVRLFARQGYGSTGLRELARAADVNLAMINYFFGSKKGLLKEILDEFLSGFLAVAEHTLRGEREPRDKIRSYIHAAVAYFARERDALVVTITELPHDDPEIIAYKASWGRQMMEIIDREICSSIAPVAEKRLPAALIGPMLTSVMASRFLFSPVMEQVRTGRDLPLECSEYADIISDLVLWGLVGSNEEMVPRT